MMSEFIVLGLVPGTRLQITFVLWIFITVGGLLGGLVWADHKKHILRNWLVAANVFLLVRGQQIKL